MAETQQLTDLASGARTAMERSADLWLRGAEQVTAGAGSLVKLPTPRLDQAAEQYFEYLQRSLEVNRKLAQQWGDVLSSLSEAAQSQAGWLGDAVQGHTAAVRDWLTAEIDTVQQQQQATAKRVDAVAQAERERVRSRYQGLTKTELSDALGKRDLPRTGTVDELVKRLVDADTR